MKDCPIGLICGDFECDRAYCFNLIKPWPLPLAYGTSCSDPEWQAEYGVTVGIPRSAEFDSDDPDEIEETARYNHWVESVWHGFYEGGWWEAIRLPYKAHPDGGLLVFRSLELDESVTFACPWNFPHKHDQYRHFKGFEPPVPIHGYQKIYGKLSTEFANDDYPEAEGPLEDYPLLYCWSFLGYEDELSKIT